jgi:hypothetical protein
MVNYKWLIIACYILTAILLLLIVVEDFKHRAVRWWFFPLLGIVVLGIEFNNLIILDIVVNGCFILTQLALLSLYFSIKEKKVVNITRHYLGWGDILLWLVACLLFASLNFMFFFMGSLLFTTLVVLVWRVTKIKPTMTTVPLAGIQAFALLIVFSINLISDKFSFRDNSWIEKIIAI